MDKIHHKNFDIPLSSLKVNVNCNKKSTPLELLNRNQEEFLNPQLDDKMARMLKKVKSM